MRGSRLLSAATNSRRLKQVAISSNTFPSGDSGQFNLPNPGSPARVTTIAKTLFMPSDYRVPTSPTMASATIARFSLVFYAPPSAVLACKTAIFKAGAGRYPGPGNYTECCWSATGTGQFRPGDAANPHIGNVGELEETSEVRVETLCVGENVTRQAVNALKS
ncbi:hypothetical protein QQS21_010792 [Conoideocrella luteorostrata]|uniref:ATP phosphoribosyltransferase n=1 Tax=Conoideocrella luteorostrata TaxID=1105319 RepID=A0AAJ0CH18_9HYPO|nr:hypothetical protein QQS21_010792 [Conoideocrella luteorostrata]